MTAILRRRLLWCMQRFRAQLTSSRRGPHSTESSPWRERRPRRLHDGVEQSGGFPAGPVFKVPSALRTLHWVLVGAGVGGPPFTPGLKALH